MPLHSFSVGQTIEFDPGKFDPNGGRGTYTVVRLLPNDGSDREYRVKNVRDGDERVGRESQLRRPPPLGRDPSRAGGCLAIRSKSLRRAGAMRAA